MLTFPFKLCDIDKFERKNNISITVTGINKDGSYLPLRHTKNLNAYKNVDLLLTNNGDNWHYVLIKNLCGLIGSQYGKHKEKIHICRTCYHGFSSAELLKSHTENGCVAMTGSQIVLPEKGEVMKFENINNKFFHPLVIYGDFESTLKKIKP